MDISHPFISNAANGALKNTASIGVAFALACCLCVPANAGPLENAVDRIENKVDNIQIKLQTVAAKTNAIEAAQDGLQPMLERVKGITGKMDTATFDGLSENLEFAQDLLAFLKLQTEGAGNSTDHADVGELVSSLIELSNLLMTSDSGSAPNVNFQVLEGLVAILPDPILAVSGKALAAGGLDANALANLQALVPALLRHNETKAQDNGDSSSNPVNNYLEDEGWTNCEVYNQSRQLLKADAAFLVGTGLTALISGKVIAGTADTFEVAEVIEIHGYVGREIKTDITGAIGQVMAGIGQGVIEIGGSIYRKLRHCELLYHARKQDEQLTAIMANQETIKQNQENILRESCAVTRYRSPACQALL